MTLLSPWRQELISSEYVRSELAKAENVRKRGARMTAHARVLTRLPLDRRRVKKNCSAIFTLLTLHLLYTHSHVPK